jgi:hypothetical protein
MHTSRTLAAVAALAALLTLTACADRDDSAGTTEAPTSQAITIQMLTADDFAAGVPADGIIVSVHACQPGPRCEPAEWYVTDGLLYPVAPHNDFRVVWLR